MKQPLWKTLLVGFLLGIVINLPVYIVCKTNPFLTFRISERIHIFTQFVNDNLPANRKFLTDIDALNSLNSFVHEVNIISLIDAMLDKWKYTNDLEWWDVANPPVKSFISLSGDCDDAARLFAYIEHQKGYVDVYYVTMGAVPFGHAVSVYYDPTVQSVILADVNGLWGWNINRLGKTSFNPQEHICQLVHIIYPKYKYIAFWTWDMRKILWSGKLPGA